MRPKRALAPRAVNCAPPEPAFSVSKTSNGGRKIHKENKKWIEVFH